MNNFDGGFQKKQEEEDERVRKEIKEYEQVNFRCQSTQRNQGSQIL